MGKKNVKYHEVVSGFGLDLKWNGPWAASGQSSRTQGWKLHISSIPQEAERLLEVTVPLLRDEGVEFKFARDEPKLVKLNEGRFGRTQVGKFLTIYPSSDAESRRLAKELIDVCERFHGPRVPTDVHLGGVVYTRYGGFNPIIRRNRLGIVERYIVGPDGRLRLDEYSIPFEPPEGVSNPFETDFSGETPDPVATADDNDNTAGSKGNNLIGPGYRLVDVLKTDAKGSVFLALDFTSHENLGYTVIKEGRHHCLSDRYGRDIRTRLRRQNEIHDGIAGSVPVPESFSYFEVGKNGYLALEFIKGENLSAKGFNSYSSRPVQERRKILRELIATVDAISKLHAAGFAHRDLTPSNIRVTERGKAYLIDLELAHRIGSDDPTISRGTFGFMSPQQVSNEYPSFSDDIFSVGSILVVLLAGLNPRFVLYSNDERRKRQLEVLSGAPSSLAAVTARCLQKNPAKRPGLDEIRVVLREELDTLDANTPETIARTSGNKDK